MVNYSGHPDSIGVTRLTEGEVSRPVRVRAHQVVFDRIKGMTAAQIGDLIAAGLDAQTAPAAQAAPLPAPAAPAPAPAPSRPAQAPGDTLGTFTSLYIRSSVIPQRLKNELRRTPESYAALEALLGQGEHLTAFTMKGQQRWQTVQGVTIRRDTVVKLFEAGVLAVG